MARALDVSVQRLMSGSDRPGTELRDIAVELRCLGIVDLWVRGTVVPGGFRRPEEVLALTVAAHEPNPRILEAIPAALAWNEIDPVLLRAYSLTTGSRTARRLAWLADIALAINRKSGFPAGCRTEPLVRFIRSIDLPSAERDVWDDLGHPMKTSPTSPIWKRWRINYAAAPDEFEKRAWHLVELRTPQYRIVQRKTARSRKLSVAKVRSRPGRGSDRVK
jgi:hypothetical protein